MEILGANFFDWLCDGSDVNEAFKLDEVADLNLPSDLPTTSGQHTGNKLARMCNAAGISAFKTNHSLRVRLYQSGVDEQLVMERTGHRSIDGIRSYKRTADFQRENIFELQCIKTSGYRVHAFADGIKTCWHSHRVSKCNEECRT